MCGFEPRLCTFFVFCKWYVTVLICMFILFSILAERSSTFLPLRVDDYGVILIETIIRKEVKVSVMVGRGKFTVFPYYLETQNKKSHSRSPCTLLQKRQKREAQLSQRIVKHFRRILHGGSSF